MKKILYVMSLLIIASMVLTACGGVLPPPPRLKLLLRPKHLPRPKPPLRPKLPLHLKKFRSAGSLVSEPAPILSKLKHKIKLSLTSTLPRTRSSS